MAVHHASDIQQLQRLPWFHLLAALGALYLGAVTLRLLVYLGLPNFLRSPTPTYLRRPPLRRMGRGHGPDIRHRQIHGL